MVAVGATVVGSINNVIAEGSFAVKGDCHGFFKFGGSTVLVLFQPGTLTLDADLRAYALQPLETYVRVGEHIGKATATALRPVAPAAAAAAPSAAGGADGAAAVAEAALALRPGTLRHDDADYAAYLSRAEAEKAALLAAAAAADAGAEGGAGGSSSSRRPSAVAASLATAAAAAVASAEAATAAAAAADSESSSSLSL